MQVKWVPKAKQDSNPIQKSKPFDFCNGDSITPAKPETTNNTLQLQYTSQGQSYTIPFSFLTFRCIESLTTVV